jgi:hypothetical protein
MGPNGQFEFVSKFVFSFRARERSYFAQYFEVENRNRKRRPADTKGYEAGTRADHTLKSWW